jgi:hypothetical protein
MIIGKNKENIRRQRAREILLEEYIKGRNGRNGCLKASHAEQRTEKF